MPDVRPPDAPSILLVDDDDAFRSVLARSLRNRGYDVRVAATHEEALASVRLAPPLYAIIDVRMPGRSGVELVEALKRAHPTTTVVVLTGDRSEGVIAAVGRSGASYLAKPADTDEIVAALERGAGAS